MKVFCPTCNKKTDWEENAYRPFCSDRCKLIDLGRWASGDYRIPGEPAVGTGPEESDASSPLDEQNGDQRN